MNNIYPTTFLISSNDLSELERDLEKAGIDCFKRVFGCYKGNKETSLCVLTDMQRTITSIAKKHKQESILKLDCTRHATLLFTDGKIVELGQWTCTGTNKPDGDYTFDGRQYYTVK